MIGKKLGHYEIVELLGRGGMGEVYLARDQRLERTVALKLLPPEFASNEDRLRRFEREARAASALKHPNITHIYDVGEVDGIHFIVMEHVEGETLKAVSSSGGLKPDEIVEIVRQVADALDDAHSRGITHRDVKPANILLTARRQPKVLDFGLAKVTHQEPDSDETSPLTETKTGIGTVIGTVHYMSPEQALGKQVDWRTDIFSLGVVLYELATGKLPFTGETPTETITKIVREEPISIDELNQEVPRELAAIVGRCLEKEPERRYQSARELAADLKALQQGSGSSTFAAAVAPAKSRSRVALLGALGVLAVAILAVVGFNTVFAPTTRAVEAIAVLPFENATGDPEVEYLSDGISESLIHSLSKLPDLRVTSRSSAFVFKDQQRDLEEIGSKLGVEAVVLGRLVQRGDEISISAELVDVADRHQLWGERYERSIDDLLSIEQEIATTIALKIRSRLSDEQAQQLTHRQTDDSEAYRLYLRGRQYMVGTLDEMDKAVSYFQQAIEREPLYAMAHAGLAQAYVLQGYLLVRDRDEAAALANAAAKRALELDDSLAEARTAAGMIKYYFEWDWEGAEEELRRAVELSPGNAEAYEEYSNYLMSQGRYDEAVKTAQRGAEFDPLSILPVHQLGIAYMAAGDFESAAAQFRQAQELRPSWVWGHIKRGKALAHMGRCDESQEEVTRAEEILAGRGVLSWSWIGWIHAVCGEEQLAREKIEHLQNLSQERHVDPVGLAIIHAGLGNEAEAIELLEQSFSDRSPYMVFNGLFPEFYSIPQLRQNPRFQELLHKLNL